MDGFVLVVLAAYQNYMVSSEMMTLQVSPDSNIGKIRLLTRKS